MHKLFSIFNAYRTFLYVKQRVRSISCTLYIYIYIYIYISSCRTASTAFPDPFLPPVSIVHSFRQVFKATSNIGRELLYIDSPYLPTPLLGQDMTQGQFFKWSSTGLNSEFSFSYTSCLTKAEEPCLPYYFTHSWRENNWIHTFPKGIRAM